MRVRTDTDRIAATAALTLLALVACAPKQRIPLDACHAEQLTVYVDGRLLEPGRELELTSNVPHKLFFKREGQPPRLVVLRSTEDAEGNAVLEPADPCQEVVAIGLDRKLQLDVDESEAPPPPPDPGTRPSP
jgi:hypothetical protein